MRKKPTADDTRLLDAGRPASEVIPIRAFDLPWLFTITFVVIVIGLGTFYATSRLKSNTRAVGKTCEARNEQIDAVNAKFAQLNFIFDVALKTPRADAPPPSEEILRLFREFSQPIPPVSCKDFAT